MLHLRKVPLMTRVVTSMLLISLLLATTTLFWPASPASATSSILCGGCYHTSNVTYTPDTNCVPTGIRVCYDCHRQCCIGYTGICWNEVTRFCMCGTI